MNFDDDFLKMDAWAREKMEKFGWFAHFVPNDPEYPNSINYHTHGLEQTFGHPDLQISFPLAPDTAHAIFSEVVNKIKEGVKFEPGIKYPEIIGGGLCVEFINAIETNRRVLRLVFPDKDGSYNGEVFSNQFRSNRH